MKRARLLVVAALLLPAMPTSPAIANKGNPPPGFSSKCIPVSDLKGTFICYFDTRGACEAFRQYEDRFATVSECRPSDDLALGAWEVTKTD